MTGLVIAYLLKDNAALLALVPTDNIFPYHTNENTALPAIIYTIDSIDSTYDKDGWCYDEVVFSVASFSDDYSSLQNIVEQVRDAIDLKYGNVGTIKYKNTRYAGQKEDYDISSEGDVFGKKISFSITIHK